jgi:hypothetical protein
MLVEQGLVQVARACWRIRSVGAPWEWTVEGRGSSVFKSQIFLHPKGIEVMKALADWRLGQKDVVELGISQNLGLEV